MTLDKDIQIAIEEILEKRGYELYELKYFLAGGKRILRIFADSEEGINLEKCAEISTAVSEYLDTIDFESTPYTLEVSSPGIDRPLIRPQDFKRVIGKEIKLRLNSGEKKSDSKAAGKLISVGEDEITIQCGKESHNIPFSSILSGKLNF